MHTTDSVDYGIVISGQMTLVLDDQRIVDLKPGDCVIQNGTRHAWWNRGRRPCVMAIVLVGADRKSTRLNSSHLVISYAVFCLKKKKATAWKSSNSSPRRTSRA